MRVGDGQLRLVGNRFAAGFIAFTHTHFFCTLAVAILLSAIDLVELAHSFL
jgi:hypothetical protein